MEEKKFDLIMQLTRVEWLLHKYHQQNHMNFGPMGDTRKGQGRILSILKMKPEISQKELSYLLEMRPQSMGELLTKLEKKGYISRTPSKTDRRVLNIKLTKEGEEATAESTESEFSFDKVFECLNDEEQQNLSSYLDRIIRTLESQVNDEQTELDFDPRMKDRNPYHGKGNPRFGGRNLFDERFGDQENMNGTREPGSGIPPV
jgi:DNA-binding MarR family transcriptional regulator